MALLVAGAAHAAPIEARTSEFGREPVIPHANAGGIRDWYAANDRSIYLMDRPSRWYLATLSAPCVVYASSSR